MLQIERIKRPIRDEKEFKKLKNYAPFDGIRQVAKGANFSLLFGAAPYSFMSTTLEPMWALEQAQEFIKTKNLYELKDKLIQSYVDKGKIPPYDVIDYLTCSTAIRNTFFEKYIGLLQRIERNKNIVLERGYTRTYHGVIRRLPLLMLSGKDDDYKEISGYVNIAANSEIQSLEVCKIMPAIVKINRWFRRNNLKSRVWCMVHDSVDFYLFSNELNIVVPKVYEVFEQMEKWQKEVPLTIEFKIADPEKGQIYKEGIEAREFIKDFKG